MASESFTHAFLLLFLGLFLKISSWMPRNHSFHLSFICLNKGLSGRPQIGEVIRSHKVKNNPPFPTILQPHHPGAARSQDYLMFA